MKAKIKYNDIIGRWKAGEIGEILENTFPEKYDYPIRLQGMIHYDKLFGTTTVDSYRDYFFYSDEVELLNE